MRRALVLIALGALAFPVVAAGASTSTPNISPEYTWTIGLDEVLARPVATKVVVHAPHSDATTATKQVVDSTPTPEVVSEMPDPIHYTGPAVTSDVPGGQVVTDHPVGMPSDPRVVHCTGDVSFGAGGTWPAASSTPAYVDSLIARGVCTVVG